jgi:nicotinamidase-related amidase
MTRQQWLVVIDMPVVFGEAESDWFTPGYPAIEPAVERLVHESEGRVVFTRFIAPEHPCGAWLQCYGLWPFALVPATDRLYEIMPAFAGSAAPVVSRTTFGKWDDELAAADAGVAVSVVADACAGLSPADHQRALDAMAPYAPLIEITSSTAVLAER